MYVLFLHKALSLIGLQSTVALVFFVTYTIFQPPATIMTRKIGPRQFLSGLCVAWGLVMVRIAPLEQFNFANTSDRIRIRPELDRVDTASSASWSL